MDLFGLLGRGDFSGPDGPYRLIGDHDPAYLVGRQVAQRAGELPPNHCASVPRFAFGQQLADADNRRQARRQRGRVFLYTVSSLSPRMCRRSLCPRMT